MNEEFKFSHILIFGSISVLMIVIYWKQIQTKINVLCERTRELTHDFLDYV